MQADNYQCCAPFMERVSADDVPDYYEIVTNPMDLSTVRSSRFHAKWDTMLRGIPCYVGYHATWDTMLRGIPATR
jgi:hypothetical protein